MNRLLYAILIFALILASFCASIGVATTDTNKMKAQIDSLKARVDNMYFEIQKSKQVVKPHRDTLVFDVHIKPQTIKIYNTCTN